MYRLIALQKKGKKTLSFQNQFQSSASLNLDTLNTILSGTKHI